MHKFQSVKTLKKTKNKQKTFEDTGIPMARSRFSG